MHKAANPAHAERMSSLCRHILDLDRRGLLRGATAMAALAATRPALAQLAPDLALQQNPFTLGVASGDPRPDGMVLWTRLAPDPLAPMGGLPHVAQQVGWDIAEDDTFSRIVQSGTALARPELGFSVHVEVAGLAPSRPYWYRFHTRQATSPTGRTRTVPAADAMPDRFRLVSAGCQNWEHGHFTAWRHIAEEAELDAVFHYGDYIYESGARLPGSRGRVPSVRPHAGEETYALDDYRQRYAQYRGDPDLAAAHAAHPFIATFDDHEVDNNWAGASSEEDGSARHPILVPPEIFALRKAAAFQAWYEAMPVRASVMPRGDVIRAHRRLRFGRLVSLHALDTRQFRDDQPCGDVTGPPCEAVTRPDAQMLGTAQETWLLDGLAQRPARWEILAQQVMMMCRELPQDAISMDKWDAYPAARARLLAGLRERRVANAVVLSGDVHTAWAGSILGEDGVAIATEFTAPSISSEGDGSEAQNSTEEILRRNPHIAFFNNRRGYTLHEATAGRMETIFRALPYVSRPGAPREDKARFVLEHGRPLLHRA